MQKKETLTAQVALEQQQKAEEERQKLVLYRAKLPNGAVFTRLKPVGTLQESRN